MLAKFFHNARRRFFPTPEEIQAANDQHIAALKLHPDVERRVRMTVDCRDADAIPKVRRAGKVIEEDGTRVQYMHNGVKVLAGGYHGDWMSEIIRQLRGHHEPQEEWAFHTILKHIRPGGVMLELGSFWAYFSLWFAVTVSRSTNYLIEPDANNMAVGLKNFELNGLTATSLLASVGAVSVPPRPFTCESTNTVEQIPEISVDDYVDQHKIAKLDLILADIQGAELPMLHGLKRSLEAKKLRFIVVSTHHHSISGSRTTHQDCLAWLKEHRATVFAEHAVEEGYSGDGVIVASFDPADANLPKIELGRNEPANSLFRGE
jgi:FkbM family methyltransferase